MLIVNNLIGFGAGEQAGGAWTTIASPNLNATNFSGDAWSGNTVRQKIASAQMSASGGTKIRITFKAGSGAALNLSKVYVGNHPGSGDAYDTSAMTQILFGGSAASGSISAGATKLSDEISFVRTAGRDLVIAMYTAGPTATNYASRFTLTGYNTYYKGGDDASTANATGYSDFTGAGGDAVMGVHLVELFI